MNKTKNTYFILPYRFGFNGMEKDDEVNGVSGANYTAEFWEYDARIGRRWNTDPISYAWQSPYACFNNNPIYFSDPSGLEAGIPPSGADPTPNTDENNNANNTPAQGIPGEKADNGGTYQKGGGVRGGTSRILGEVTVPSDGGNNTTSSGGSSSKGSYGYGGGAGNGGGGGIIGDNSDGGGSSNFGTDVLNFLMKNLMGGSVYFQNWGFHLHEPGGGGLNAAKAKLRSGVKSFEATELKLALNSFPGPVVFNNPLGMAEALEKIFHAVHFLHYEGAKPSDSKKEKGDYSIIVQDGKGKQRELFGDSISTKNKSVFMNGKEIEYDKKRFNKLIGWGTPSK